MKKILSILFAIIMVVAMAAPLTQTTSAATTVNETYVQTKINNLNKLFPDESYFTNDGDACSEKKDTGAKIYSDDDGYSWCNSLSCQSCSIKKVLENNPNAIKAISQVSALAKLKNGYNRYSCCAFATFAFCYIFEHDYLTNSTVISTANAGLSEKFLSTLKPGDLIKCYKTMSSTSASHWAIYLKHDDKYVYFYESNNLSPGRVEYNNKRARNGLKLKNTNSWVKFVAFRSNEHTVKLTVKDNYKITANDGFLALRKTASTSSTKLGEIPTGTIITVTDYDENGNWGKVIYNGTEGWCRLYDVKLVSSESSSSPGSNSLSTSSSTSTGIKDYYKLTSPDGYQTVRESGSLSAASVGTLYTGDIVCITKYNSDKSWGYLDNGAVKGWIKLYYVQATTHSHSFGSYTTVKAATCTTSGSKTRKCTGCSTVETTTITALGHNYSTSWTIDVAATCTTAGSKSHHCTRCSAKSEITTIAATGHSYGAWTTTKAATCLNLGTQKRTCSACSASETKNIAALGHSYSSEWTVDKQASCITEGSKSHHCTRCSVKGSITAVSPTGHNFGAWQTVVEPTTTANGTAKRLCTNCTATENKTIPALATDGHTHNFGEWVLVKEASCKTVGTQERACSICEVKEIQEISVKAHKFSNWAVKSAATEQAEGIEERKCTDCEHTETRIIPKLPQSNNETNQTQSNITSDDSSSEPIDNDGKDNTFLYILIVSIAAVLVTGIICLTVIKRKKT